MNAKMVRGRDDLSSVTHLPAERSASDAPQLSTECRCHGGGGHAGCHQKRTPHGMAASLARPVSNLNGTRTGVLRCWFTAAAILTVAVGLASRHVGGVPQWVGDLLWSTMVFLLVSAAWPRGGRWRCGAVALTVSWLVELTQLYHPLWLDRVRGTTVGHLVLGSTFLWTDLVAYIAGVAAGIMLTWPLLPWAATRPGGSADPERPPDARAR